MSSASVDVAVVGGGLVGCLCALRLADAGARVTVLEKSVPGAEASSAAAGILAAQSESPRAGVLFDLCVESRELYAKLAEELRARVGVDVGYARPGVLEACATEEELAAREAQFAWQRGRGMPVERWSAAEARGREPGLSDKLAGGVFFPHDGQVDPPRLVAAVAQAAERAGVRFKSGTLVRRVRAEGGRVTGVETDEGLVPAARVVVAAGAWSTLVEGANLPPDAVRPARGQIVELSTRTPPLRSVVFGAGGYLVPRADGRVICGSTLEFVGYRNEVTAGGLLRILGMAVRLVPALEGVKVTGMWSNFRPYTADATPLVGSAGVEGLTVATGHYRSGILLAPVTAEIVREHVLTGKVARDLGALRPLREGLSGGAGS